MYYRLGLDNHNRYDFKHVSLNFCNFHLTSGQILQCSLVRTSVALISGPYFIKLVHLPVLSILSSGPDCIYLSLGPDFIKLVRFRILSILSPGPGPDLIKAVWKASPGQDINF